MTLSCEGERITDFQKPAFSIGTDSSEIPLIDDDEVITPKDSSATDSTSQRWQDMQLLTVPEADTQYQITVRSFASIGLGVSNGRKILVRQVDTAGEDPRTDPARDQFLQSPHASSSDLSSSSATIWWKATRHSKAARMEFFLSFVGLSIGLANIWRFPWLCYKHGGGAFLFSYYLIMFLCAAPLMVLELSVGQFTRSGPVGGLRKLCPLSKGLGVSAVIVSLFLSIQYGVVESYSFHYFYTGFPGQCQNSTNCQNVTLSIRQSILSNSNSTPFVLYGWLLVTWTSIFMFAWRGFRSNGRSYYVTATLPIIVLVTFMTLSVTLEGADLGVRKLFTVEWDRLGNTEIWIDALSQSLHAFVLTSGVVMVAGSYGRFTSEIIHSCAFLTVVNGLVSIISAITVFAAAASLTERYQDYVLSGPGLVFEVYVYAVSRLPLPQLGAAVFLSLILCSGLNTQMVIIEVVVLFCQSTLPNPVRKILRYREILSLALCLLSFSIGCAFVSTGNWIVVLLIDNYIGKTVTAVLLAAEIAAVAGIYGVSRLSRNIREMTRKFPSTFHRICWIVVIPAVAVIGIICTSINYSGDFDVTSDIDANYIFGGWMLVILVLLPIPAAAFWVFLNSKGNDTKEKFLSSLKSEIEECSCCHRGYTCLRDTQSTLHLNRSASAPQLNAAAEAAKRYFTHTVYDPHVTVTGTNVAVPLRTLITSSSFFRQPAAAQNVS